MKLLVTIHVITKSCSRNASQLSENSPPTFDFNFSSVRSSLRYDAPLLVASHASHAKAQFISSILFVYILVIFRLSKGLSTYCVTHMIDPTKVARYLASCHVQMSLCQNCSYFKESGGILNFAAPSRNSDLKVGRAGGCAGRQLVVG